LGPAEAGNKKNMSFGTSIFLFAVGAILRYAVTARVSGISLPTLGLILMLVGAAGLLLAVMFALTARARGRVVRERVVERDPY
jgi:hypothetical protein